MAGVQDLTYTGLCRKYLIDYRLFLAILTDVFCSLLVPQTDTGRNVNSRRRWEMDFISMLTWIRRDIGAAIFGAGTYLELIGVMSYIVDTYQKYAARAMAAIVVLRSILAVILPLGAPSL